MNKFNLEKQFQLYLQRVKLIRPGQQMPADQLRQLRMAFMGGVGQLLEHLVLGDEKDLSQEEVKEFSDILALDLLAYWKKETEIYFSKNN